MSPVIVGVIALAVCFALIFLRMPIAFAFGISGFVGLWYLRGASSAFHTIATIPYTTGTTYIWTVMPLFILMGLLAYQTKMAEEFYEGVRRWIGQTRGGLAHAVIVGNTAFGAVCGDLTAAALAFTMISLPEMRKYGYKDSLTLGSIAAGSMLSMLIPPSMGFILYGAISSVSIGQLFIAGIFPGLLLMLLYMITISIWCWRSPDAGPPGPKTTWKEKWSAAPGMWALILAFGIIIGGLYFGVFTPTEAGAVGAFVVLAIGLGRRKLSWEGFKKAILDTGFATAMVIFLITGVLIFNRFLVMSGLPTAVTSFIITISGNSPLSFMFFLIILYFILGCFMDAMAVILLTVPIFFPVAISMGISPLVFGVVAVMTMNIGAMTPPYGMIIYVMSGVVKDVPLFKIFKGVAPFLAAMVILEILVVFFPQIVTWLPATMMGR